MERANEPTDGRLDSGFPAAGARPTLERNDKKKKEINKRIRDRKRVSTALISPAHFNQAEWCLIYVLDHAVSKHWT